jgi:hypothetical protein
MVTVVMTTYAPDGEASVRRLYAERTLRRLIRYLHCSDGLRLHIADDGSASTDWIDRLLQQAGQGWEPCGGHTDAKRHGIGASLNRALETLQDERDLWMYITDDWLLTDHMDLDRAVTLIRQGGYEYVRLGPIHPNLIGKVMFNERAGWWLDLWPAAGGFCFATRPFLATRFFWNHYGPFLQDANAYDVEQEYSERVANEAKSRSAWLRMAHDGHITFPGPWEHIGEVEVGTIQPRQE